MSLGKSVILLTLILIQTIVASAATGDRIVSKGLTLRAAALRVIPQRPLDLALYYFDAYARSFPNKNYLTVIDYRIRSGLPRMFILNLRTGAVESLLVAHGKGSDPDNNGYLNSFSNEASSLASSMGIYRVAEPYNGEHGLSARLDGLQTTNLNARPRAVVIHGADYVNASRPIIGRSWGCPAIDLSQINHVVNELKNGSLLFVYGSQFESLVK